MGEKDYKEEEVMRKIRVLLVDDEITALEGFRRLFNWEAYGCELVGEAMDGISAMHMVDVVRPDLVIMDINLPLQNGIETIKALQRHHSGMNFIIASGYDDFKYCQEALRLNVVDYILKPVDFDKFGEVIRHVAENLRNSGAVFQQDKGRTEKKISDMLVWIEEHLREDISLSRLAEEFHFNSSYISQLFKSELGINFHVYLSQIRVNHAKRYLKETDLSVSDVSDLVGFPNYRVFTRVFKTITGEQPSKYRGRNYSMEKSS